MRLICLRGEHEIETRQTDVDAYCYEHKSDFVTVDEYRRLT